MATDMRESRETRIALAADGGAMAVLRDSRRRVRMGSLKAAQRLDRAIAAITTLVEAAKAVEQTCVRHDSHDAHCFRRLEAALHSLGGA